MALKAVSPPSAGGAVPAAVRLTWPEAFIITLAVGLTIYLNVRDTPIIAAAGIAAGVMVVFVAVLAIPRGIGEIAKNLNFLRTAADELARQHHEQEGRR
ncbi:hypothetical protein [Amycolatopsis decaplanina]|uniref:Uncharacterized protein n=1 Tax=Amycolatopsis decaplanina DSM 44594 TaxID=1284240 RepID=M2YUH1_9PSEU|nr:hypothetical protein [Amycolatopsis decaplanina]EME52373.1 hypothetical protein H074_32739 [Amycolatopsis decaplanina DSM 44594]